MNIIDKLLKLLDPESNFEDEDQEYLRNIIEGQIVNDTRNFNKAPCHGSLEIRGWCKGCYFESEHVDGR